MSGGTTTPGEITGEFGVVASTHPLATACGMEVLEAGGNAFDAAVAAGFVLQIAEPDKCGPGGDVTMVCWSERDARLVSVCGQGTAPVAATIERYRDEGLDEMPGSGLLSAVVPGAFDAWMHVLERWGTRSVRDVLAPAIAHAWSGIPAAETVVLTIQMVEQLFAEHWPTSAALWFDDGRVPAAGANLRLTGVADTYARIVAEAEAAGAGREAQVRAARDAWGARLRGRGDQRVQPRHRVDGHLGRGPPWRARRRRPRGVGVDRGGAGHLRLRPLHRGQDRPVGSGSRVPPAARAARRARRRRRAVRLGRAAPPRRRSVEARVRRSGSLVRRRGSPARPHPVVARPGVHECTRRARSARTPIGCVDRARRTAPSPGSPPQPAPSPR